MTTTATPTMPGPATSFDRDRLDDAAQALIDARLETIERMLFGQTPRADRLAIVREVESQIHELLAGRDPNDTDRDAVIAALARLDPPEAYLPDEAGAPPRVVRSPGRLAPAGSAPPGRHLDAARGPASVIGKAGGILGIVAIITTFPAAMLLYVALNGTDDLPFYAFAILCLLIDMLSVLAVVLSGVDRLRSPWSIVGLTSGIIAMMIGFGGSTFFLIELLG